MTTTEFYQEGDYLYHQDLGVGKVSHSTGGDHPDLTIAFEKDPRRIISAAHAARATIRLSSRGFRALAYEDSKQAAKMLQERPAEAVKRALYDFPKQKAKTIEIREYLTPYIKDWDEWWKPTQKLLKETPFIDSSRSKDQIYGLRAEMLSLAEEAFQSFQDAVEKAPASQSLVYDDPRYQRARQTLTAIAEGFSLTKKQAKELKAFFQRTWKNTKLPKTLRIDALYRSLEQSWISADEAADEVLKLLPLEEGLYSLSRFAQNRLVDHFTHLPRNENVDQVLLSGLLIPLEAGEVIEAWVRNQLDADLDKRAVLILLEEAGKIVKKAPSPDMLSITMDRVNKMLDLVPSDESFWAALPGKFILIVDVLVKVPDARLRRDFSDVFVELMRSAGKLYSRRMLFENGEYTQLQALLSSWDHPTEVRAAFLRGLGEPDLPPTFREEMLESFAAGISSDQDAKLLVEESGMELENLVAYAEQAAQDPDFSPMGAAQFLAVIAGECAEEELDELLPLMNRLVFLGNEEDEWVRLLNTYRSKVYRKIVQQFIKDEKSEEVVKYGLDPLLLHLFKEQSDQRTVEIRSRLDELESMLAERDVRIRALERSVQTKTNAVVELGQSKVADEEEVRYKERHKLAGDLVRSVAEMERYFIKQVEIKKEVEAVIIRVNGFLSGFGVEPLYSIGEEVIYDPKLSQLISELPEGVEGEIRVLVRERGYRIRTPQGEMKLLKPAIVEPLSKKGGEG